MNFRGLLILSFQYNRDRILVEIWFDFSRQYCGYWRFGSYCIGFNSWTQLLFLGDNQCLLGIYICAPANGSLTGPLSFHRSPISVFVDNSITRRRWWRPLPTSYSDSGTAFTWVHINPPSTTATFQISPPKTPSSATSSSIAPTSPLDPTRSASPSWCLLALFLWIVLIRLKIWISDCISVSLQFVINEIDSSAPTALQAVKLLALYLSGSKVWVFRLISSYVVIRSWIR